MDKIIFFDLIFLILFCVAIYIFIKTRTHNLKREGWMYLYKTSWGMKEIEKVSKKYSKLLHFLKYPIVALGFVLMVGMIILLIQTVYIYIKFPQITQVIKAPPIMPLIPYFPQIFGVQSLMPPFYFMYFLLALIIVAVVHEFSHGIYMRLFKMRIKSTGFAFLGPILGAFVEQNPKDFEKGKKFDQMVVLAAGVFANIVFAVIFFFLLLGFFNLTYQPAGYIFSGYAYNIIQSGEIASINNSSIPSFYELISNNKSYLFSGNVSTLENYKNISISVYVYEDAPAIRTNLSGIIIQMDEIKIKNREDVSLFLMNKHPGENISIRTLLSTGEQTKTITLAEHPYNSSLPFIGIVNNVPQKRGIFSKVLSVFANIKDSSTYYQEKAFPAATTYIYNLLWWIMMINLFVALFNMLPLGILDGGRFFYLTVFGLTKREKVARISFKLISYFIGFIFLAMVISWFFAL